MRPGQYVYAVGVGLPGSLPPALPVAGADRSRATVDLLVDGRAPTGEGDLARSRVGEQARFVGPFGSAVPLEPGGLHLLVVADLDGFARVRALVAEAIATGRRVALDPRRHDPPRRSSPPRSCPTRSSTSS